ncbi:hypothetical protein [Actinomadura sp. WAC 06369]|uniref:hypothetical protein n=1 Tax=Actinomadura sp. WAC 06369 TaxID=2203193 RepID=UPI000F79980C|nr:hypothetical protein [Actinomadura sp. WAC 06369]RSN57821.1 hypothetical protein DMH08_23805 [Actinomadura sp. WAC 06369]
MWAAVRGNRLFSVVLLAGVLLRVTTMLGFPPALWFNDSYDFLRIANDPFPHQLRPSGYGLFLWSLKPFHSLALVTFLQHAAVVGIAVLGYRMLVRDFGVRRHWAALAVAPVLLDAFQIELEHLLLSDTLFTVLVFGAMLGLASVTRTVGVPLFVIVVVFLLLRRTRWTAVAALGAAFVLPLGSYAAWYGSEHGRVGMSGVDGIFLWGRTAAFADCDAHRPPPDLARLCPYGAPDDRPASSHQIWEANSPTGWTDGEPFPAETNALAQRFAVWAIMNQPFDYARVVAYDFFVRTFAWERDRYPTVGTEARYHFPTEPRAHQDLPVIGGGYRTEVVREYAHGSGETRIVGPYADVMRWYQEHVRVPGTVLGAVLLAGAAGLLRRRARPRTFLFWASAVTLLAVPPITVDFDYRYMLPAMPFACFAAAVAWGRGRPAGPSRRDGEPDEPGTARARDTEPART